MSNNPEPAAWMHRLPRGRFDTRVLSQADFWITGEAAVLPITDRSLLTDEHLRAVIGFLQQRAQLLHLDALVDGLLDVVRATEVGLPSVEQITHHLTGSSIASLTPAEYLESTPLVRALRRELARRDAAPVEPV